MLFFSFCTKIPTSLSVKRFEDLRQIVKDPFFFMHYRHLKRKHGINNNKRLTIKKFVNLNLQRLHIVWYELKWL